MLGKYAVSSCLNALQHSLLYTVWAACTSCRSSGQGPRTCTCGTAVRAVKQVGAWVYTLGQIQTLRPITYAQRASVMDDMDLMVTIQ